MSLARVLSDRQQWGGPSWEAGIARILTRDLGQNFLPVFWFSSFDEENRVRSRRERLS